MVLLMSCEHTAELDTPAWTEPTPDAGDVGCPDCRAIDADPWSHLRMCLTCGHVACCDSSPHRHAEAHSRETGHLVMRSFEPGESWRWCYADRRIV